jgi:hypothetical protein
MTGFKTLIRIATLAAGVALAAQAGAAQLKLDMPSCTDFAVTGAAPNQTLVCNTAGAPPSCTVAPQPATAAVNATVKLTATCTNAPTGYTWVGCSQPGVNPNECLVTNIQASPATGTVLATNAAGPGPTANWTVNFTNGTVPPSGCTVVATPNPVAAAGNTTTLTASCTGGGAPTSWSWTGAGIVAATTATNSNTATVSLNNTTYTVTPSNLGGNGNTASVLVGIAGGAGGGGGGSCTGFSTKNWGAIQFDSSKFVNDLGDGTKEVAVLSYTVTSADAGKTTVLDIFGPQQDADADKTVWVSKTRCEMTPATQKVTGTSGVKIGVSVNGPLNQPNIQQMAVGETWYFMIRNVRFTANNPYPTGKNTCIAGLCPTTNSGSNWVGF